MHDSAYFPNKRELTLTTFNNPCDFFETFSQNLLISLKLTVLVSSFLKQPVEENEHRNHALYKRSFYDRSFHVLINNNFISFINYILFLVGNYA